MPSLLLQYPLVDIQPYRRPATEIDNDEDEKVWAGAPTTLDDLLGHNTNNKKHQQQYDRANRVTMVQIAPGVTARLRGADETWHCIEHDFFVPITCMSCTTDLCCILDALYVLCPVCRVVSPMEKLMEDKDEESNVGGNVGGDKHNGRSKGGGKGRGGVGLGFTVQDLIKWQREIITKCQHQHQHQHQQDKQQQ